MNDTISIRKGEELNPEKLAHFLHNKVDGLPEGELNIRQFGTGHSNLTYALEIDGWEAVLRRPPLGPIAPKTHDMKREFAILSALNPVFPTAPKPIVFSDDLSITGSPFFIMERRHGIVLDSEFPVGTEDQEALGQHLSEQMVDKLVELHAIDYKQTALADMVKPDGFLERQVHGWIGRYEKAKTSEIAEVEQLTTWLIQHIPKSPEPTIIHYDYKFNNAMFSHDYTSMNGLFDWEMATVGDPLADVGAAMSYWMQADDPVMLLNGLGKPPLTTKKGFYTRDEFIASYAEKSGRDMTDIHYYTTFAYFKLAVICQQIYYRYKKGQTNDPRFKNMDKFVYSLVCHSLMETSKS
ncbi:phosphotransferase family protein [Sporosarcina pasteurii]|uniref:Thiamine kinase n=1 Tax=Sporosarcina pasteurii TaxID=1474 RepID=A0A380C3T5_SPOPA|nr:phosphotransferase family protein [Sporosarcina pasteurii]MDS9471591.1 phosphotransferase family protein [Sporosarcina pasteurii]QBQ04795.1 phosphotransferase family protein [Sporosarcina pasteurii]SUJ11226.1 thiamine kinase [Sporosarcina pasteurii]